MSSVAWPEVFPTVNQPDHEGHLDWTFECGAPSCTWSTYHRTQAGAQAERERHHHNNLCPYTDIRWALENGVLVPAGRSIIEQYWEEMDKIMSVIMDGRVRFKDAEMSKDEREGYLEVRGQAQGLAKAIAIISVPHFVDDKNEPSVRAVSQWAMKRYRMSKGEIEHMDTPGCRGYNPMPLPTREVGRKPSRPANAPKTSSPKSAPSTGKFKALKEEEREHIKNMVSQGIPDGAIVGMLKISVEQLEAEKAKL